MEAVKKRGVTVHFVGRQITTVWNKGRQQGEPVVFGGWYWVLSRNDVVVETDTDGPFRSKSAAIRDAWTVLQLKYGMVCYCLLGVNLC